MAFTFPPNFEKDIQARDISLFPVVILKTGSIPAEDIMVSTKDVVLGDRHFKPLLLNIPSLKESIDIENRNYKISNITLDISNAHYENQRFSDVVFDNSLINIQIKIYWISPSYSMDHTISTDIAGDDYALQVYDGVIRRYTHNDERVKLTVEDRSQANLHTDLPLIENWTGSQGVPEKYTNKPIPMVFGKVDKSPCVMTNLADADAIPDEENQTGILKILIDSDPAVSLGSTVTNTFGDGNAIIVEYPLYAFNDGYHTLNQYYGQKSGATHSEVRNYKYENNEILILAAYLTKLGLIDSFQMANITRIDPIILNENPSVEQLLFYDDTNRYGDMWIQGWDGAGSGLKPDFNKLIDKNSETFVQVAGTHRLVGVNEGRNNYAGFKFTISYNPSMADDVITYKEDGTEDITIDSVATFLLLKSSYGDGTDINSDGVNTNIQIFSTGLYDYAQAGFGNSLDETVAQYPAINTYDLAEPGTQRMVAHSIRRNSYVHKVDAIDYYWFVPNLYSDNTGNPDYNQTRFADVRFHEFHAWQHIMVDELETRDYYANVIGRISDIPQADEVIKHIMTEINPEIGSQMSLLNAYSNWKYQFTVAEKISSKTLIENVASASPFIPHFNQMGSFKFDTIPNNGGTPDHDPIKESDIIDFTFSRTRIEDVKTRIDFHYNWDYGREKFNSRRVLDVDNFLCYDIDESGDYKSYTYDYYGFKESDHTNTTLIVDDHRGKHIRQDATAERFITWLLSWYMDQHLIMKVKLPLKYMNIEVGDIVNFDKVIGGILPYGIDYSRNSQDVVPYQTFYKNFMVTNTNKKLDLVEIECIQLHTLWDSTASEGGVNDKDEIVYLSSPVAGCSDLLGCTDSVACNYDDTATLDDGSCAYQVDCAGICGGDTVVDGCGICGGTDCPVDCAGIEGGSAVEDECGICNGSGIPDGDCDCYGNTLNECGVCGGIDSMQEHCTNLIGPPPGNAFYCDCDCNLNWASFDPDNPFCGCGEPPPSGCDNGCGSTAVYDECYDPTLPDDHPVNQHSCGGNGSTCNEEGDRRWMVDKIKFNFFNDNGNSVHNEEFNLDLSELHIFEEDPSYIGNISPDFYICADMGAAIDNDNVQGEIRIVQVDPPAAEDTFLHITVERRHWNTNEAQGQGDPMWRLHDKWETPECIPVTNAQNGIILEIEQWMQHNGLWTDALLTTPKHEFVRVIVREHDSVTPPSTQQGILDLPIMFTHVWGYWLYQSEVANSPYCINPGDVNGDGSWNVLDIVTLANCVLVQNCGELVTEEGTTNSASADMNFDGTWNVLDIVLLANCVLSQNCAE